MDDDLRAVHAVRIRESMGWPWYLSLGAAEFLREEPLETDFREAVTSALRGVRGVRAVEQEDREVWLVAGHFISGKALVTAVDRALTLLEPRMRQHMAEIMRGLSS